MINKDFYPTPSELIDKMLTGVQLDKINIILEPSAGKGDIVEAIMRKTKYSCYTQPEIDCVEIDKDLISALKGKNFKVVHNDFLTFETFKKYDLIVANFPFSDGDKHLLKALNMQSQGGGIVCLVNAETIRNPYTNTRKEIVQKLTELDASIEYIENAFVNAERPTNVEVALIKVFIPQAEKSSLFFEGLKTKRYVTYDHNCMELTTFANQNDYIEFAVEQYNREVELGIKLINEYEAMKPYIKTSIPKEGEQDYSTPILNLQVMDYGSARFADVNEYIRIVRYKYWDALFSDKKFVGNLTRNLVSSLHCKLEELKDYDFSVWNIMTIKEELIKNTIKGIEDTILDLFEDFTIRYSWNPETSKNIHYYNGWCSNKAYKINKKIIMPYNAYDRIWGRLDLGWKQQSKFTDIVKVFHYLAGKNKLDVNVEQKFREGYTTDIDLGYFSCTFYKKGTCHITFKDLDLLEKFNLYGSQRKGWLFHEYGRKAYKDMNTQEKELVKEFSGSEEEYNKIFNAQDYYILDNKKLLMIE